jgi:uncharacterized protein YbjT (DUF2867 family)
MEVNIFGASGLVGELLLKECLANEQISQVNIFVRKTLAIEHEKLKQHICTYETLNQNADKIKGAILFNCLGTTLKIAGSQEAQYKIDALYPIAIATIAAENNIKTIVSVSSVGASEKGNFYLKTKSDMEKGITQLFKERAYFIRPSFLVGDRKEFRMGESLGIFSFKLLNLFLQGGLKKYRSISAQKVARAMQAIAIQLPKEQYFEYDQIIKLSAP